jgi:hypothetical protein
VASSTGFLDHGQLMVTFSDHDGFFLPVEPAGIISVGNSCLQTRYLSNGASHEACGRRNGIHGSANLNPQC